MRRTALPEKPATTPLPGHLGASDGTAVSVPPLTMPTRGPRCTLGDHRVFNRSCWGRETGLPWQCWPVPTDPHGTAALPDTTVANVCARGSADGSRAEALLARVGQRSDPTPSICAGGLATAPTRWPNRVAMAWALQATHHSRGRKAWRASTTTARSWLPSRGRQSMKRRPCGGRKA